MHLYLRGTVSHVIRETTIEEAFGLIANANVSFRFIPLQLLFLRPEDFLKGIYNHG